MTKNKDKQRSTNIQNDNKNTESSKPKKKS